MRVVGLVLLPFVVACSLMTPLDDLGARNDASAPLDASFPSDSGADATAAADAVADVAPPIPDVPLPATCKKTGFRCAATPPPGWSPPFAFYSGAAPAPACPAAIPIAELDANVGLGAVPPATCGACSCNASNIGCGKAQGNAFQTAVCTGSCFGISTSASMSNGACQEFACSQGREGSIYVAAAPVTATCTPTAAKPTTTLPPLTWSTYGRGCRAPTLAQVDCASGEVCATEGAAPFDAKLCVAQAGNVACPAIYTAKKGVYQKGTTDTRDCSACGCGSPSGNCAGTATPYTAPITMCSAPTGAPVAIPGCVARGAADRYLITLTPPGSTSCPASGGTATGTATAKDPVTVCCEP